MVFVLNGIDFTANVIPGTYKINTEDDYQSFYDAYHNTHRQTLGQKVRGTFDVFFKTLSDYETFVDKCLEKDRNGCVSCTLTSNNEATDKSIICYLTYKPARNLSGVFEDFMDAFQITIEER